MPAGGGFEFDLGAIGDALSEFIELPSVREAQRFVSRYVPGGVLADPVGVVSDVADFAAQVARPTRGLPDEPAADPRLRAGGRQLRERVSSGAFPEARGILEEEARREALEAYAAYLGERESLFGGESPDAARDEGLRRIASGAAGYDPLLTSSAAAVEAALRGLISESDLAEEQALLASSPEFAADVQDGNLFEGIAGLSANPQGSYVTAEAAAALADMARERGLQDRALSEAQARDMDAADDLAGLASFVAGLRRQDAAEKEAEGQAAIESAYQDALKTAAENQKAFESEFGGEFLSEQEFLDRLAEERLREQRVEDAEALVGVYSAAAPVAAEVLRARRRDGNAPIPAKWAEYTGDPASMPAPVRARVAFATRLYESLPSAAKPQSWPYDSVAAKVKWAENLAASMEAEGILGEPYSF
jgi:hypothetical protein